MLDQTESLGLYRLRIYELRERGRDGVLMVTLVASSMGFVLLTVGAKVSDLVSQVVTSTALQALTAPAGPVTACLGEQRHLGTTSPKGTR